jgi:large-conductance mechanosensitive channel
MLSQAEIKTFVIQNNILGYSIAMIIALTLKDFVATFIGNFIVPASAVAAGESILAHAAVAADTKKFMVGKYF